MCLSPTHSNPFIAEKDIFCKKRLIKSSNCLYTPFRYVPIVFNKGMCIQQVNYFTFDNCGDICRGIHSYSKRRIGLPSGPTYPCIVPKGTQYYIGDNNDLVSLKLIIFKNRFRYWIYKVSHK